MAETACPPRLTIRAAPAGAALAAALASAACFLAPAGWLEAAVGVAGLRLIVPAAAPPLGWTAHAVVALATAAVAAGVVRAALAPLAGDRRIAVRLPARPRGALAARRADRHPDAPTRAPIRAASEFGPLPAIVPGRVAAGRAVPADLDTPILSYAGMTPLGPGERIAAIELAPAACAEPASLEALLARLERGARPVARVPAATLEEALGAIKRSAA